MDVLDRFASGIIAGAIILYLFAATGMSLTRTPICDEGWYADPAVNLVTHGNMGSPVIEESGTRRKGIARYTYYVMPLHTLMQAGWYTVFGTGLVQLRALSIAAGLTALLSWWFVLPRVTGSAGVPALALLLIVVNPVFLTLASTGRSDMLAVAFGAAAQAVYLALRTRRIDLATLAGHALVAAAGMTHPVGGLVAMGSLIGLEIHFDRSRIRARHFALAGVPYAAAAGLWLLYILRSPADFMAQYGGNASGRLITFSAPLAAVWREFERVTGAYTMGGQTSRYAQLRLVVLAIYVAAVGTTLLRAELRRSRAGRVYLPVLGLVFATLYLVEGSGQWWYLLYAVLPVAVLTATALAWIAQKQRTRAAGAACAVVLVVALELGYPALSIARNKYSRAFLPLVDYVRSRTGGARVLGSAELGFGVGFDRVLDDRHFGYYSHSIPELIVMSPSYRAYIEIARKERPDVYRYEKALLSGGYREIYSNGTYAVLSRVHTFSAGLRGQL